MSVPGVSIVTVALNAASALPLTLESAIAQDYADKEIVVVDGGSWDDTSDVLRRYAPVLNRVVTIDDNGIYYAMNEALDHVTKTYVLFLNAGDQFFSARAVSRMIAADETADVIYGDHVYVMRDMEAFRRSSPFDRIARRLAEGRIDGRWLEEIPCHQAMFVRADLLRRLRFDTRLRISADHDLLFRAHSAGASMRYVDETVCHYFGGGFSAAAGERTRLEGASVYRSFSDRPDRIDHFFYPEGAPFAEQTRRTGVKLGGFLPPEGWMSVAEADLGDWVAGEGAELLAPKSENDGIEIAGYNQVEHQRLSFWLHGDRLADVAVPRGSFRIEVAFDRSVPPEATIRVVPARAQTVGERAFATAGLAVRSFRFARVDAGFAKGFPPGEQIRFRTSEREIISPLLGRGWSATEGTHLWSLGDQSDLWLKLASDCARLRIEVSGNPHVSSGQRLSLYVNGHSVVEADVGNGRHATLEVACDDPAWHGGAINHLVLRPSAYAIPPAEMRDTRPLGFCLWHIDVE